PDLVDWCSVELIVSPTRMARPRLLPGDGPRIATRIRSMRPMSSVSTAPPVRHGLCALYLRIGGTRYKIRRVRPAPARFTAFWVVRALGGERAGAVYSVAVPRGREPGCTCPDHEVNGAICKHLMALAALGLIRRPRAARPRRPRQPGRQALRRLDQTARAHPTEIAAEGAPL